MRGSLRIAVSLTLGMGALWAAQASAFPDVARETKAACAACHASPAGGSALTDAGTAYKTAKTVPAAAVAGADYIGSTKCKICHMTEYTSWKTMPHAASMIALASGPDTTKAKMAAALKLELKGPATEEAACLRCHTTGYTLPGGYPGADSVKAVILGAVSCESCHGPGSKHVAAPLAQKKLMINRMVSAAMCTQCHTPDMSPAFNFEEYKAKGVHQFKKPAVPAAATGK